MIKSAVCKYVALGPVPATTRIQCIIYGPRGFYEHGALSAIKTDCQAQLNTIAWMDCFTSVIVLAAHSTADRFLDLHCISVTLSRYRLAALRSCLSKITVYAGAPSTTCCLINTTSCPNLSQERIQGSGLFWMRQMVLTHADI